MTRATVAAIAVLLVHCAAQPADTRPQPRATIEENAPAQVRVADILEHPQALDHHRVTIEGCYTTDPLILHDANTSIALIGGSNDIDGHAFDPKSQQVCGTFVGSVFYRPADEPLKTLCPDVCFVSEYTVAPRIVGR